MGLASTNVIIKKWNDSGKVSRFPFGNFRKISDWKFRKASASHPYILAISIRTSLFYQHQLFLAGSNNNILPLTKASCFAAFLLPRIGMGRGSFPKFPIGNFPKISERKFRYLSGIIPFFIIALVYIKSVSHKAWACR